MPEPKPIIYPWLRGYWAQLTRYLLQDKLPSALMLVGDPGLGLAALAEAFSNRVVCLSPVDNLPCGSCESCLLFNAENYPDFFYVRPEDEKDSIKIEAIREISASLALSTHYNKPRMVILDPADGMTSPAANSLLKTLEEPSENTCLILITHRLVDLPATIKSRCQLIKVNDVDQVLAQAWLSDEGCHQAHQYLSMANHVPLFAYDLWQKNALEARDSLLKDFLSLLHGRLDPILFAEKCFILKGLPVLKWLTSWLTDAIKYAHGSQEEQLINSDLVGDLKVLIEKLHLEGMSTLVDDLSRIAALEKSQVNQQLMFEEFAIQSYSITGQ